MSEEYSNDGGMVSDSALRKGKSSSKTKIPKFRKITRNVPRTEFGEAMGGFTVGMTFVFPALAFLSMAYPVGFFSTIGVISLIIGLWAQSVKGALFTLGICLGMVLLGFVSIGILMAILS